MVDLPRKLNHRGPEESDHHNDHHRHHYLQINKSRSEPVLVSPRSSVQIGQSNFDSRVNPTAPTSSSANETVLKRSVRPLMAMSAAAARYPVSFRSSIDIIIAQKKDSSSSSSSIESNSSSGSQLDPACLATRVRNNKPANGAMGMIVRALSFDPEWYLNHRRHHPHQHYPHRDNEQSLNHQHRPRHLHHEYLSTNSTIMPNVKTRVVFPGQGCGELESEPASKRVASLMFHAQHSRLHFLHVFHGAVVSLSVHDAETDVVMVEHSSTATMPRIPIPDLVAGRTYAITICLCHTGSCDDNMRRDPGPAGRGADSVDIRMV